MADILWSNTRIAIKSLPQAKVLNQYHAKVKSKLSSSETIDGKGGGGEK